MNKTVLAGVAVQKIAYHVDKLYDYRVPSEYEEILKPGCRVLVSFGQGGKLRQGLVCSLRTVDTESVSGRIKPVSALLDEEPLIKPDMIKMAEYMRDSTFCTLFDAVQTILPSGLNLKTDVCYSLKTCKPEENLSPDEKAAVEYLEGRKGSVMEPVILGALGLKPSSRVMEDLYKKGIVERDYRAARKVKDETMKMVALKNPVDSEEKAEEILKTLTPKQRAVFLEVYRVGACSIKELCYFTGVTQAVPTALVKKGLLIYFDKEVFRTPYKRRITDTEPVILTEDQEKAYRELSKRKEEGPACALLFGVTGSGKTQVYLKLIDDVIEKKEGAIVMVPEIALTPQLLKLFYGRYGDEVAVFHSGLSDGERLDEWKRVEKGIAHIVVGTRSAVFAPVENLSLIVMDEEQEHSYKSDRSPRYHARDIAKYRCAETGALLLLASATPSIGTYAAAESGVYSLHRLESRYGDATLPEVEIVDMKQEGYFGKSTGYSRALIESLRETVSSGNQAILLMNRRGYNTYAVCDSCGEVATCPHCSISLTYHRRNGRLMCHYCGYSEPFTTKCSKCGADGIKYTGAGTQKVEEELEELVPGARILRMDADTTMRKYSYDEKLQAFQNRDYDIMVGTQMVAKGFNFERVTLVGVLSADSDLYSDDYKSSERTFSLLTQVVGRSGRGAYNGKAIIQTKSPENETIQLAARQDYDDFYSNEVRMRRLMTYPPFCTLITVTFSGTDEERVYQGSRYFRTLIEEKVKKSYGDLKLILMGPFPERIYRIGDRYRYRLVIKCRFDRPFRELLSCCLRDFGKDFSGVTAVADREE